MTDWEHGSKFRGSRTVRRLEGRAGDKIWRLAIMRRMAISALSVWIGVAVSIALFTLFWRIGYARPHFLWGALSLAAILIPMAWLAVVALWRCIRGPGRLRALGWLLIGVTPLIWIGIYLAGLIIKIHTRSPPAFDGPVRVTAVWASTVFDVEALWRYPRRTRGRHVVLIDDGRAPFPEKAVAEMDDHVEAMADVLGRPVPDRELLWVRGSLFGLNGVAICLWAICEDSPSGKLGGLGYMERHEVAHTLITAMGGPDHYPPRLLLEGWAESQSDDREGEIRSLARQHKAGWNYSLQGFVRPDGYDVTCSEIYTHGGPLVHYLIHRYGGEAFARLYFGVHPDTFHDDCRAILGDSWETVEEEFWIWLEAEDEVLARAAEERADTNGADKKGAEVHFELAESVDPADWRAMVEGYRDANRKLLPFPSNAAFILECGWERKDTEGRTSAGPVKFELRAVFEGRKLWIYSSDDFYCLGERLLIDTPEFCGVLNRGGSGPPSDQVRLGWMPLTARNAAWSLLESYRRQAHREAQLPFREYHEMETFYRIGRLVRPAEGETGQWSFRFTTRLVESAKEDRYDVTLDPAKRWWPTRLVGESPGEQRLEREAEYEHIGDAFLPVSLREHVKDDEGTHTMQWRARPMSEVERRKLKHRVEETIRAAPKDPRGGWGVVLGVIAVGWPGVGVVLVGVTRRDKTAPKGPNSSAQGRAQRRPG